MKRFWLNVGVSLGTTLVVGAIASACAHNDSSVFIRQVFAPVIPTNGSCIYTADVTQAQESTGTVDVSFANLSNYTPWVLVGNQIISQGNLNALQTETSRVIINGAITRVTDLAGDTALETMFATMCGGGKGDQAACTTGRALASGKIVAPINPFSTVESTAIEPASASTASYAAIAVTMVDGATVAVLRDYFNNLLALNNPAAFSTAIQLLTFTKLEGVTLGGDNVESNEFEFPVTFTYGSLIANQGINAAGDSCIVKSSATTMGTVTCVPGQDAAASISSSPNPAYVPFCIGAADASVIVVTPDAGGG